MKTYKNLVKQTGIAFFPVNIPGIAEDCPFESFIFFVGGFALGGSYRNVFHFILCLPLEANPYIYMYIYIYVWFFLKNGIPSGNQTWQWEIPQFNDFFQRETSI